MIRTYLFRMTLALIFLGTFWFGRDLARAKRTIDVPAAASAATREPHAPFLAQDKSVTARPQSIRKKETLRVLLQEAPPARLYGELFDHDLLTSEPPRVVFRAVRERFRREYPANERAFADEMTVRAGVLKAMHAAFSPGTKGVPTAELYNFYRRLVASEPWLVRRQALKNIRVWLPTKTEIERTAVFKAAGERALASVDFTDDEILLEVFHE